MYSMYSPGQAEGLEAWPQASAIVVYNDYNQRELYTGWNLNKITSKKNNFRTFNPSDANA